MTEKERLTTLIKEAQEICICTEEQIDCLLANGVMVSPWVSTAEYTPELYEIVIAIVNGKYKNLEFIDAIQLCEYTGEGWIVTEFPEFENAEVDYWMHLPSTPSGRSGEIRRVNNG